MVATTRTVFDRQLTKGQDNVLRLSELVATQVSDATRALQQRNVALAQRVSDNDTLVNHLRFDIEESSYTLLALQQPNSRDMRRIVSTVNVVTNLERMGDHAAGIARLALRIQNAVCVLTVPEFDEMAQKANANLQDAMTALVTNDEILARATIQRDADIDALHQKVYTRLMHEMSTNAEAIECATMLLWVSHNLERYADRVSNICQQILYVVTGQLREHHTHDAVAV